MKTTPRIVAFIAILAVVFAASVWVGRSFGPESDVAAERHSAAYDVQPVEAPGGLQVTESGYTLDVAQPLPPANRTWPLEFRVLDQRGAPVTQFDETHEKLMHLIVVRNDLSAFQHVHPVLDDRGTWRTPVDFSRSGDYRVFADFVPTDGPALTLGANVHVAGPYSPVPLPAVDTSAAVDEYTVTLSGVPKTGEASTLSLTVHRDGVPVYDLQPYLGAYGHLVALRAADLAYLHVHPLGGVGDARTRPGPAIEFHTTFPSAGQYRLFLDFQHRDVVRTAEFTVSVDPSAQPPVPTDDRGEAGHGH
ncbi:hypothetical protein AU193_08280 [Mycobacterium sp. GA-1285]|uniref:hypothetical protein n=1 Tax=Mycobacterium sp. GA-1285 TaxID=1772282 RepID=UPI000748FE49|nr:hypothetical protein [Mycobacterium sp. GA-1285]KUI14020.1 hypothetical protein AU193_08280 [Mycobacterium sp. GA-1285]